MSLVAVIFSKSVFRSKTKNERNIYVSTSHSLRDWISILLHSDYFFELSETDALTKVKPMNFDLQDQIEIIFFQLSKKMPASRVISRNFATCKSYFFSSTPGPGNFFTQLDKIISMQYK